MIGEPSTSSNASETETLNDNHASDAKRAKIESKFDVDDTCSNDAFAFKQQEQKQFQQRSRQQHQQQQQPQPQPHYQQQNKQIQQQQQKNQKIINTTVTHNGLK